jgi:hypothetical protein
VAQLQLPTVPVVKIVLEYLVDCDDGRNLPCWKSAGGVVFWVWNTSGLFSASLPCKIKMILFVGVKLGVCHYEGGIECG